MWVFLNDAYVSIVEDREDEDMLWVRARVHGDVDRFFRGVHVPDVKRSPNADYLFRAKVPRATVGAALQRAVLAVDYDNFKDSIAKNKGGDIRHNAYLRVWSAMMAFQQTWKRTFKK